MNSIAARGESLEELRADLAHMLADVDQQILDLTTDPPRLVPHEDVIAEDDQ